MDIGGIVILCIGLVFALIGLVMMLVFQKGNRTGEDTGATVLSTRKSGHGKAASYFATLQYQVQGQTYTVEISTNTIHQPDKGQTLIVGIDPYEPERVHLRRGKSAYMVFYVMGGLLMALAVFITTR